MMHLTLDMLVQTSPTSCAECNAPLERGDVVWLRPTGENPNIVKVCCVACVKRIALPIWEAEQERQQAALRAMLDHDVKFS